MSDITVDLDFECDECGAAMEPTQKNSGTVYFPPCAKCMQAARDEAWEEGRDDGLREAENA